MAILNLGRVRGEDGFDPVVTVETDTEDCYQLRIETRDDWFFTPNLKGRDAFDPVVTVEEDTGDCYRLRIETKDGEFITPNFKGRDAPVVIGEYHFLGHELDPFECAELRYLPLKYQLIEIADYQELCDLKYCGDGSNNTADWWYKCDHQGNRTVTGLYMRVEDPSGLFFRIAGQNAVKNAANNAPYDGNSVGAFCNDGIPRLYGQVYLAWDDVGGTALFMGATGVLLTAHTAGIPKRPTSTVDLSPPYSCYPTLRFSSTPTISDTNSVQPASVSVAVYMRY